MALKTVRDLGLKKIWFWADSMIVVEMLQGNESWNPIHKPLITQCKQLIAKDGGRSRYPTAIGRQIRLWTN